MPGGGKSRGRAGLLALNALVFLVLVFAGAGAVSSCLPAASSSSAASSAGDGAAPLPASAPAELAKDSPAEEAHAGLTDSVTIAGGETPLQRFRDQAWSLLNLILAAWSALVSVGLAAGMLLTSHSPAAGRRPYNASSFIWRLLAIVAGIASAMMLLLTENFLLEMAWLNQWTPLMVVLTVSQLLCLLLLRIATVRHTGKTNSADLEAGHSPSAAPSQTLGQISKR